MTPPKMCELWVTGTAEYYGYYAVDVVAKPAWSETTPLPTISFLNTNPGGWSYYSSTIGGTVNDAGWYGAPTYYLKNCVSVGFQQPCDCLNGGCVPAASYNTPGVFSNLADCEAGCAKNAPCKGECVSAAQLAALNQAISKVRPRLCK